VKEELAKDLFVTDSIKETEEIIVVTGKLGRSK
jgi:hypothetical protein